MNTVDDISEDEFWMNWGMMQKDGGGLFAFEDVKNHPHDCVWTIIESDSYDNENWYVMPGFHIVNKLGYIMTERRSTNKMLVTTYFLKDQIRS